MTIIERLPEHYEEREMVYGRAYKWCPETIVIQCECGEELTFERSDLLIGSARTCECGKDHIGGIREEVQDKVIGATYSRMMSVSTPGATGIPPRIPGYLSEAVGCVTPSNCRSRAFLLSHRIRTENGVTSGEGGASRSCSSYAVRIR